MTNVQPNSQRRSSPRSWPGHILSLTAIATFVYLLAAQWAEGFRLDWWRPWRDPLTVPIVQLVLLLVLVIHVGWRIWHRRLPVLAIAAVAAVLAGRMGLYRWSCELGERQLSAEVTAKDVADECFLLIHSPESARQDPFQLPASQPPNDYPAIRRLHPEWITYVPTTVPAGEEEMVRGDVVIKLTPFMAYTFYYSEEAGAWVLMEAYREGGSNRLLVQLPVATRPATQPE